MFENLQNSFNGMFGKVAPGMCRLTMNGNIAVKCGNGYKSYNVSMAMYIYEIIYENKNSKKEKSK